MSGLGLGGYESSDDEDEPSTKPVPTLITEAAKASKPTHQGISENSRYEVPSTGDSNAVASDGPMVGPTMPERLDLESGVQQAGYSPQPQQHMSERETVHYLTQASHPMTSIPPSPPGSPAPALNAKFKRFLELKTEGVHFNEDLASKPSFRNPGLLATMMTRAALQGDAQYKTSLPTDIFDPTGFPPSAYKEELWRSQQNLKAQEQIDKKSLSAAGKRTIEFTSGGTSATSSRDSTPGVPSKRKRP